MQSFSVENLPKIQPKIKFYLIKTIAYAFFELKNMKGNRKKCSDKGYNHTSDFKPSVRASMDETALF